MLPALTGFFCGTVGTRLVILHLGIGSTVLYLQHQYVSHDTHILQRNTWCHSTKLPIRSSMMDSNGQSAATDIAYALACPQPINAEFMMINSGRPRDVAGANACQGTGKGKSACQNAGSSIIPCSITVIHFKPPSFCDPLSRTAFRDNTIFSLNHEKKIGIHCKF